METKAKAPKEKRRNHERRKEKSRDAARSRRSRETEIFTDLATALPLTNEQVSLLDKASIMRLAISYLKVREMISLVPESVDADEKKGTDGSVFLKSLDGFILVLSVDGDFIYLSDNVCDYLGLTQVDLMGQNIFDYSHPCDHEEIRETLSGKSKEEDGAPKSMSIRMKCTLTSKGRSVNLKSATYKVIQCKGHMTTPRADENGNEGQPGAGPGGCFMAVGQPIPHPANIETPLLKQAFLTKHGLDMKFTHADDDLLQDLLGYDADDLVGKSAYDFHHAMDSEAILSSYKCLFSKGQCETSRYRFLAKTGGYVWVVTQATLIYDKVQKPQSVVCVNYVVSGRECRDEICSAGQQSEAAVKAERDEPVSRAEEEGSATARLLDDLEEDGSRPLINTSKIFGPLTQDMNKGFLTFSDQKSGLTMLKDEPDDLTHLAPVAGGVCVPLEEEQHPFLTDMLEDIFLRDSFTTLLAEQPSDPFISYRDFQDSSPLLLSPNLSKQSDCSLPSLNSPSDSLIDEDQMSTFMNLQMEDEPDMAAKNVFAPVDKPLLICNDLMWSNGETTKKSENSSLARLLSSNNDEDKHNLQVNGHGGGLMETCDVDEEMFSNKCIRKTGKQPQHSLKRACASPTSCEQPGKRRRAEPRDNLPPSELLHQLMSSSVGRGRPKGKSATWGAQKAACVSQPSDSVLMNLLDHPPEEAALPSALFRPERHQRDSATSRRRRRIREASISLLDPEGASLASLMDLTQQDCEVNAPACCGLLQGLELLTALDTPAGV